MDYFSQLKSKIALYLLRVISKELVVQGPHNKENIVVYYAVMVEAARKEYREETNPGLISFLEECHDDAIKEVLKRS